MKFNLKMKPLASAVAAVGILAAAATGWSQGESAQDKSIPTSKVERLNRAPGRALVIADLCGCIGLVRALQLGARGYVGPEERLEVLAPRVLQAGSGFLAVPPGPADALRIAMRVLVRESTAVRRLSETDLDVMRWLSRGETAGEIANRLNVSESAVRNRIRRIMVRLEVRNEKELSAVAATAGLYEPRTPAAV